MRLRPGLAVDLGTVNTLVHVAGRGLVVDEPSVVAFERHTGKVLAVGSAAEAFSGREPEGIDVVWPLRDGVIADFEAAALMLHTFFHRAHVHRGVMRPSAVFCVPRGATVVERRAVASTVEVRRPHCVVHMVEEPVAAAVGAGANPTSGVGTFVVDVGGGTTDIAVVAGGGVVRALSLRIGGNAMDDSIARAVKTTFGLSLGHRSAEQLKIALGLTGSDAEVVGVDVVHEELRSQRVPGELVAKTLERPVNAIIAGVHEVLSGIPPGLADDVMSGKIQMAGGGAQLLGLVQRIEASTGIETSLVQDPLRCVVRGAAEILQHDDWLRGSMAA